MRTLRERRRKNSTVVLNLFRCRFAHRPLRSQGQQDRHRDGLPRVTMLLTTRINAVSRSTNITQSPQLASAGLINRGYCSLISSGLAYFLAGTMLPPHFVRASRGELEIRHLCLSERSAQLLPILKFISGAKRSNFENRTKSSTCIASEKDGPFGE